MSPSWVVHFMCLRKGMPPRRTLEHTGEMNPRKAYEVSSESKGHNLLPGLAACAYHIAQVSHLCNWLTSNLLPQSLSGHWDYSQFACPYPLLEQHGSSWKLPTLIYSNWLLQGWPKIKLCHSLRALSKCFLNKIRHGASTSSSRKNVPVSGSCFSKEVLPNIVSTFHVAALSHSHTSY